MRLVFKKGQGRKPPTANVGESRSLYSGLVADFCSGMGGLSFAARQIGLEIAVGIDADKDAIRTYSKNFPGAEAIQGSVASEEILEKCRTIIESRKKTSAAPLVFLSGPPCQGFSAAGSRDPKDHRNEVLQSVGKAIRILQPHCAVVENVEMLLSAKHHCQLLTFQSEVIGGGYKCLKLTLNARHYGIAQNRVRAFFLITRDELNEEEILGRLGDFQKKEISVAEALLGLPSAEERGATYNDEENLLGTPNHLSMRHSAKVKAKIAKIAAGAGPMSYRKLDPTKPANALFSGHRAPPAHYQYPRSITVREGARLQGFPDSFRIYGEFANQMMQVTNAVPPPLAAAVLVTLAEATHLPLKK